MAHGAVPWRTLAMGSSTDRRPIVRTLTNQEHKEYATPRTDCFDVLAGSRGKRMRLRSGRVVLIGVVVACTVTPARADTVLCKTKKGGVIVREGRCKARESAFA